MEPTRLLKATSIERLSFIVGAETVVATPEGSSIPPPNSPRAAATRRLLLTPPPPPPPPPPHCAAGLSLLDRDGILHTVRSTGAAEDVHKSGWEASIEVDSRPIGIPGRPLGSAFDSEGRLVICDSVAGLLRYDPRSGTMEILANSLPDGTALRFVDDVAISAADGKIYFSSASQQPIGTPHATPPGPLMHMLYTRRSDRPYRSHRACQPHLNPPPTRPPP